MAKVIDPICTWCNKPDSKCKCQTDPQVFSEPEKLLVKKSAPGVDVSTYLMEFIGLLMFYIGFLLFTMIFFASIFVDSNSERPGAFTFIGSMVGFFSTFGIMLSGSIMYLLARINHRLWTT